MISAITTPKIWLWNIVLFLHVPQHERFTILVYSHASISVCSSLCLCQCDTVYTSVFARLCVHVHVRFFRWMIVERVTLTFRLWCLMLDPWCFRNTFPSQNNEKTLTQAKERDVWQSRSKSLPKTYLNRIIAECLKPMSHCIKHRGKHREKANRLSTCFIYFDYSIQNYLLHHVKCQFLQNSK